MKIPYKNVWSIAANNFKSSTMFPLFLGAVDGEHIGYKPNII